MSTKLVVWGATGQAKVVHEALVGTSALISVMFDNDASATSPFAGVPLHHGWDGFRVWRDTVAVADYRSVVAIGGARGRDRVDIGSRLEAAGLRPWTVVHAAAYVAGDAEVGAGSQVMAGATIATLVRLGRWCLVNTSALVDHECELADGVHVGPGARLAGCVQVGERAMIGTGATIGPRVILGKDSIVGAGAVVLADVRPGDVVVGNPARVLRHDLP